MTVKEYEKQYLNNAIKIIKDDFKKANGDISNWFLNCEYCPFHDKCDLYEVENGDCEYYLVDHIDLEE